MYVRHSHSEAGKVITADGGSRTHNLSFTKAALYH